MSTQEISVSISVQASIPNTRTYALACKETLDMTSYANQVIVQQFFQQYKNNSNYRFAVTELKDQTTGLFHSGGSKTMIGTLLQVFDSFSADTRTNDFSTLSYKVYVITFQSPEARNPTVKVVSIST